MERFQVLKIVQFPPSDIFDRTGSTVSYNVGPKNGSIDWGAQTSHLSKFGNTLDLNGGVHMKAWRKADVFFDVDTSRNMSTLSTESYLLSPDNPPIKYIFLTKPEIVPGNYTLTFAFTYFNGSEWDWLYNSY